MLIISYIAVIGDYEMCYISLDQRLEKALNLDKHLYQYRLRTNTVRQKRVEELGKMLNHWRFVGYYDSLKIN